MGSISLNLVQEMVSILVFGKDKNNFILAARLNVLCNVHVES